MATTTKKTTTVKKPVAKKAPVAKATSKVVKPVEKKVEVKSATLGVAKYLNKNLKVSPRKLRLVVSAIKQLAPAVAYTRLKFTNTNAARILSKAIEDAIASAKNNHHLDPSTLKFSEMRVDEGMKIKRMDKGHGSRFARGIIQKRHSRLVIVLSGTIQS
jgi:large subunit ribosomal protein L22